MIPYLIEQHSLGNFPLEEILNYYDIKDFASAFEDMESGKTIKAVLKWI
jgi:Zn-dependent alcohol dehydrogenase